MPGSDSGIQDFESRHQHWLILIAAAHKSSSSNEDMTSSRTHIFKEIFPMSNQICSEVSLLDQGTTVSMFLYYLSLIMYPTVICHLRYLETIKHQLKMRIKSAKTKPSLDTQYHKARCCRRALDILIVFPNNHTSRPFQSRNHTWAIRLSHAHYSSFSTWCSLLTGGHFRLCVSDAFHSRLELCDCLFAAMLHTSYLLTGHSYIDTGLEYP